MAKGGKNRLYVTLYAHGKTGPNGERLYHWALTTGPKDETKESKGLRFDVRNFVQTPDGDLTQEWRYERRAVPTRATQQSLFRIRIAKVTDEAELDRILAGVPVRQNDASWRCRHWVRDALLAVAKSGRATGTAINLEDWDAIEAQAKQYGGQKFREGRWAHEGDWDLAVLPTYDMMEGKEVVR